MKLTEAQLKFLHSQRDELLKTQKQLENDIKNNSLLSFDLSINLSQQWAIYYFLEMNDMETSAQAPKSYFDNI